MLVISLVMMVVLLVIGLGVTTNTSIELNITGNERRYKDNFYQAEAVANQAIQILEDAASDDIKNEDVEGIGSEDDVTDDITDEVNWTSGVPETVDWDADVDYLIINAGVTSGGSLVVTGSQVYSFDVSGRSVSTGGSDSSIITIGDSILVSICILLFIFEILGSTKVFSGSKKIKIKDRVIINIFKMFLIIK